MCLLNIYSFHLYTTHQFDAHFHTINILNFTILFSQLHSKFLKGRTIHGLLYVVKCFKCTYSDMVSVQFSSVAQSCPSLCNPTGCNTPGLPVHHELPEFTQTHVHRVGDAIQPSHPLSSPSPPTFNPSQHQGLFRRVSSLHQVAKGLEFQPQHQSFRSSNRPHHLESGNRSAHTVWPSTSNGSHKLPDKHRSAQKQCFKRQSNPHRILTICI